MANATLAAQPIDAQRFERLRDQWKSERGPASSITQMAMHPAYQEIVGMGPSALPFLLRELEEAPDHWFWALKSITGVDPVDERHRGNLPSMSADWLNWARDQGIQW